MTRPSLSQLSSREQQLLLAMMGIFVFVLTWILFHYLWSQHRSLSANLEEEKKISEMLAAERQDMALLRSRDVWLQRQSHPMLAQDVANEQLLAKVQEAARGDVLLSRHEFLGLHDGGHFQAMGMAFEATAEWEPFLRFLYDLQSAKNQISFERLEIRASAQDKSKVVAKAKIFDLYQP